MPSRTGYTRAHASHAIASLRRHSRPRHTGQASKVSASAKGGAMNVF